MGIPDVLAIIALVLGIIEVFRSQAQSLLAWSVVLLAVAILWHLVPK